MKHSVLFVCIVVCLIFAGCNRRQESAKPVVLTVNKAEYENDTVEPESLHLEQTLLRSEQSLLTADDVTLIKELFYDQHTLEDTYPYKDTVRSFKWDEIRESLAYIENMQADTARWVVLQNYKNQNKEAPLVRKFVRNAYRRVSDTLGVERYQSVPLYLPLIRWYPNVMEEMVRLPVCGVKKEVSVGYILLLLMKNGWCLAVT